MKKIFLLLISFFTLYSCSSDNDFESDATSELNTQLSYEKYISTKAELEKLYNEIEKDVPTTRAISNDLDIVCVEESAEEQIADKAQELFEPFIAEGALIRDKILTYAYDGSLDFTDNEVCQLENLDDAGLAGLAYLVELTKYEGEEESVNGNVVLDCIWSEAGWSPTFGGMVGTGTKIWMNPKTLESLGRVALGAAWRYAGWVGLVYTGVRVSMCINDKKNSHKGYFIPAITINGKNYNRLELEKMFNDYKSSSGEFLLTWEKFLEKLENGQLEILNGRVIAVGPCIKFSDKEIVLPVN